MVTTMPYHCLDIPGTWKLTPRCSPLLSSALLALLSSIPWEGALLSNSPPFLGVGSYVWNLLQAVSEAGWNHFKISPQPDAPILVEAMRTVYGPVPVPTPSPDVEMAVDAPEAEEVAFTLVTNQKCKGKGKAPSLPSLSSSGSRSKTLLISRAPPLSKAVTTLPASKPATTHSGSAVTATMTSRTIQD